MPPDLDERSLGALLGRLVPNAAELGGSGCDPRLELEPPDAGCKEVPFEFADHAQPEDNVQHPKGVLHFLRRAAVTPSSAKLLGQVEARPCFQLGTPRK